MNIIVDHLCQAALVRWVYARYGALACLVREGAASVSFREAEWEEGVTGT